jgi:D-alanyl-D-alanine carboxypeptidase (penicillin-binding protein 5/6)
MIFTFFRHFSILSTILLCLALSIPDEVFAVPIIKETEKRAKQTHSPAPTKQALQILGNYNDITHIKKRGRRQALASSKRQALKNLSAKSFIIMDAVTGQTLFSRAPDNPRQPASTIKVLTGMIAIKSLKKNDSVAVSKKAARQPRSKIYLDHQKKYQANDLINAVLLSSANDASVALAEKIAGSERSFAKMMTLRAQLWGAKKTVCKTATGLTAKGQSSTARDLATIFRHAMQDSEFAKRMKRTKVRTSDGKLLRNHNKALWQVQGTQGGKTGYTNAARQTYVGKFKRGDDEIIVAIMGSERMWTDIKKLVTYGFKKKQLTAAESVDTKNLLVAGAVL